MSRQATPSPRTTSAFLGGVAGAVGVTALNAISYLDVSVRGRAFSDAPAKLVERIVERLAIPLAKDPARGQRQMAGIGPLLGIATGIAVGAASGLVRAQLARPPFVFASMAIGATAMLCSDAPLAAMGVSDPRGWSLTDWLSDVVPHLAFGAAVEATLRLFNPGLNDLTQLAPEADRSRPRSRSASAAGAMANSSSSSSARPSRASVRSSCCVKRSASHASISSLSG